MLSLLSVWRSTRALDDRKLGGAERSQSVVHALLSAKEQVPQEQLPPVLHRKIISRLEDTQPLTPTASDAWLAGAGRAGAGVLFLLALASVVIWTTHGFGPRSVVKSAEPRDVAADDPGANAPSIAMHAESPRAAALSDPVRPRTGTLPDMSPSESRAIEQDAQQIAQTMLNALPVRQNEPR